MKSADHGAGVGGDGSCYDLFSDGDYLFAVGFDRIVESPSGESNNWADEQGEISVLALRDEKEGQGE